LSETFQYDHPGSLVALRNTNGTVAESYSYDPWGRRRNPSNWSYSNVPIPVITNRGFTGHEHLEKFNLIDMNGRVYDPVTAGFLSPDPFVTNPYFSQSYNSYSYCVNNPLKFTDPSGYLVAEIYDQSNPYPDVDYVNLFIRSRSYGFYGTYEEFVDSYEDDCQKYNSNPLFYNPYSGGGGSTVTLSWRALIPGSVTPGTGPRGTRVINDLGETKIDVWVTKTVKIPMGYLGIGTYTASSWGSDLNWVETGGGKESSGMSDLELVQKYITSGNQQLKNIDTLIKLYERELEIVQWKQKLFVSACFRLSVDMLFFITIPMNIPGVNTFKDLVFPFPEPPGNHIK
jgi:RHS repeat-associated protein